MAKAKTYKKCPECGKKEFYRDESRGELICKNCGLVLKEKLIDRGKEWRAFDAEQMKKRARTGPPLTYTRHDKGVSTKMGRGKGEVFKVPKRKRSQYFRMRKWDRQLKSKKRSLSFALSELKRAVSFLNLPRTVHESVARNFREALDEGFVRGRSIESILAGLLYAVAKKNKTPRTLNEISEAFALKKRKVGKAYRYICRKLGIRILPADPADYVPRLCSMLKLSEKVQMKALKILEKAKEKSVISGKGPIGVATASIYIAATIVGEEATQREIANTAGISEVTIRNIQNEIVEVVGTGKKSAS